MGNISTTKFRGMGFNPQLKFLQFTPTKHAGGWNRNFIFPLGANEYFLMSNPVCICLLFLIIHCVMVITRILGPPA